MSRSATAMLKSTLSKGAKAVTSLARAENNLNSKITKDLGFSSNQKTLRNQIRKTSKYLKRKGPDRRSARILRRRNMGMPIVMGAGRGSRTSTKQDSMILRRTEFIQNINGTSAFKSFYFPVSVLNPGLFPWGSSILPQYETYRLRALTFKYKSTSGNISSTSALGVVMFAMIYDPDDPIISDQTTLLNYGTPSDHKEAPIDKNMSLNVTTKNNPMPVRYVDHNSGANAFNDYGIFYYATQGNPSTSVIGELWVDYEFEVYTPRISLIPNYQIFGANGTSPSSGAYYFFDSRLALATNYGAALCTFNQSSNATCQLNFLSPGIYKIHAISVAGVVSSNSANAYAFSNCSQITNSTPITLPPPLAISQYTSTVGAIGVGSLSFIWSFDLFVDAQTSYSQGNTYMQFPNTITFAAANSYYSTIIVEKVPNPSGTSVPILPEVQIMRDKFKEQNERLVRLENLLNCDNCDNNNDSTVVVNQEDLAKFRFVEENTASVLRNSNARSNLDTPHISRSAKK